VGHRYEIRALEQLSDGRIVSGSWDGAIKIWSQQTGLFTCERTCAVHSDDLQCFAAMFNGNSIVSAGNDGQICITSLDMPMIAGDECEESDRHISDEESSCGYSDTSEDGVEDKRSEGSSSEEDSEAA